MRDGKDGQVATIGIVTAVHKGARYLPETIAAVCGQMDEDWEWVIVDDGSPDESGLLADTAARKDSRIHVIHQANRGVSLARNVGVHCIAGHVQYMTVLDQDDVWLPETLMLLRATLEMQPHAVAAHGWARYIDADGQVLGRGPEFGVSRHRRTVTPEGAVRLLRDDEPTTYTTLLFHNVIVTPGAMLVRITALPDGPFDPGMQPSEDYDFALRLAQRGSIAYVPYPVIDYRVHAAALSRNGSAMSGALHRVYAKHQLFESNSALVPIARATYQDRWRTLAHTRMLWAHGSWQQGDPIGAAREVIRAGRDYARSLQTPSLALP